MNTINHILNKSFQSVCEMTIKSTLSDAMLHVKLETDRMVMKFNIYSLVDTHIFLLFIFSLFNIS